MLEQLFGSRTRVKLLRLFFTQPEERYFVRELTRVIDEQINSVRRELQNLETIGLVVSDIVEKKKYYTLNPEFPLLHELQAVIMKTRLVTEQAFVQSIRGLGPIEYFSLLGHFVQDDDAPIDLFIIGTVSKTRLQKLLQQFEELFGKQLRYTALSKEEYEYREDVADRFLADIFNRRKMVVVDKINSGMPDKAVATMSRQFEEEQNQQNEQL